MNTDLMDAYELCDHQSQYTNPSDDALALNEEKEPCL